MYTSPFQMHLMDGSMACPHLTAISGEGHITLLNITLCLHCSESMHLVGTEQKNLACLLWCTGILQWWGSTSILCSQSWPSCRHWRHHAGVNAAAFEVNLRRRSRVQVLLSREKWSVSRTRWTETRELASEYY